MTAIDFIIIALYLIALLIMSWRMRAHQHAQDYFLAGRQLPWQTLSLSVMATQLSAVSFISAPAFVGLREGGGLIWLSYEIALPLAIIVLLWRLLPSLHRSGVISIYDFLEHRFGVSTRVCISLVFQLSRSFATAIMIYAMSIILQGTMGINSWHSILAIGTVTLVYSSIGGMKAVVYGDAAQMLLIVLGAICCVLVALYHLGGFSAAMALIPEQRLQAVNVTGLGLETNDFGLLPMILGGLVLYASYYGCDQSEAQRSLSSANTQDLRKVLMSVAIFRFPITLIYCFSGLFIGALLIQNPQIMAQIPNDHPDWMMPIFMLNFLPPGILGLLVVAILAAAMSSLSSAINSLSAVSTQDLLRLKSSPSRNQTNLKIARLTGVFWGLLTLVLSLFAGDIAPTVIEAINKIGSVFYGPILAIFLVGIQAPKITAKAANIGLLSGVGVNVYLWLSGSSLFWFWWNVTGFTACFIIAVLITKVSPLRAHAKVQQVSALYPKDGWILLTYSLLILLFCVSISVLI